MTFESRLTMRFQVQEMARTERMVSDEQIQHELDVYNRLLPAPGELSATLFLELTSEDELRTWLPRLVGIESACELRIGQGPSADVIVSTPEEEHQANLTRAATTSAVHYVRFHFTLAVNHPEYPDGLPGHLLAEATRQELAADLTGR
jgi:hypothetical protein